MVSIFCQSLRELPNGADGLCLAILKKQGVAYDLRFVWGLARAEAWQVPPGGRSRE